MSVELLHYPPEDLETPVSLMKGEPNQKYSFNFQQDYPVNNPARKQQLSNLVGPQSSGEYVFTFIQIYKNKNSISI